MNIGYIAWIERLDSAILKTQVVEMLKEISKNLYIDDKIYFISFQHLHKAIFSYRSLIDIKKEFKKDNIILVIIPVFTIPVVFNWFFAKWYIFPIIFLQSFPILLFLSLIKKIDILHCRSYPITLAALSVAQFKKVKVIFDPRSPFPEENVPNQWFEDSLSYKMWKYLEKIYLEKADITITIADTYVKHFRNTSSNSRFITIPNNVNVMNFKLDEKFRNQFRLKYGVENDKLVFCYCGSLVDSWNNPEVYARFIIKFRNFSKKHRFLFITPNKETLKEIFEQYSIKPEEYIIVSIIPENVPKYLSLADFGLNLMNKRDIRMSIKTVEYLALGLPIIVNTKVAGAKEVIQKYNVGLIIEDIENINFKEIEKIVQQKEQVSLRCRKVAHNIFSTAKVAKQYGKVYCLLKDIKRTEL